MFWNGNLTVFMKLKGNVNLHFLFSLHNPKNVVQYNINIKYWEGMCFYMSKRENVVVSDAEIAKQKQHIIDIKNLILGSKKYAFIETYGCAQNVNDSERILGMLNDMGYEKCDDKEKADIIIYNTCAVRENAELKVFGNIGALKALKRRKEDLIIGVCGCMMQQKHIADQIKRKYKHVDMVFGTHAVYRLPEILKEIIENKTRVIDYTESDGVIFEDMPIAVTGTVTEGVSVMYGCNNFCTYCIVPYVRGRERSRYKEEIISEVKKLVEKGIKEVTLLGQNVNSYGHDLENYIDFPDLLNEVSKVEGLERIRFMTSHPKDLSDKLIDEIANNNKICKQLHLPIQCGSNDILKKMNRKYTKEEYLEKIEKVKAKIPNVTLTTDIIVGFPGETNEDFAHTIDVLEKVRYDSVFSFIYSKRVGTPAATMDDVIDPDEKKANFNRLLEVQNRISAEINAQYENKEFDILVEGESKTDKTFLTGRTDGGKIVNFKGDKSLIGSIIKVKITKAQTWSLFGEII